MGIEFWEMLIKIIIFLPFVLFAIYMSLKYGSMKLQAIQNGNYIKIIERVTLSKENQLLVAKMGNKAYVVTSTNGKIEILLEVEEEELKKLEASKRIPEIKNLKETYERLRGKKEEKNE